MGLAPPKGQKPAAAAPPPNQHMAPVGGCLLLPELGLQKFPRDGLAVRLSALITCQGILDSRNIQGCHANIPGLSAGRSNKKVTYEQIAPYVNIDDRLVL